MPPSTLNHAVRLVVRPKPDTLSESLAILRHLKTFGEVTKFAKQHDDCEAILKQNNGTQNSRDTCVYSVEFASVASRLLKPKDPVGQKKHRFTVKSNTSHISPHELDPYNVRGLLDRKPALERRKFSCRLVIPSHAKKEADEDNTGLENTSHQDHKRADNELENRFSGPFSVDSNSVFAKILQQSDTPRHLIPGLLPKLGSGDQDSITSEKKGQHQHITARSSKWRSAKRWRDRVRRRAVKVEVFSPMKLYEAATNRHKKQRNASAV